MNREQFMKELERLLRDLPFNERKEAIQYYNDYFDDAGPENEARVISELGSPAQVARTIREGMSENGEYTERGYEDARFRNTQEVSSDYGTMSEGTASVRQKNSNPWKLLSVLLLCLLLFPIIVPLFAVLFIVVIAVLIGIVGLIIGAVAAAVALPFAGFCLIAVAFYNLFSAPGIGITLGGIGCILLSVGILIFLLAVWICRSMVPACIRTVVSIIRYPLRKAGIVK